jgi:hypothetical protein
MKALKANGGTAPYILTLFARWRRGVNIHSPRLYTPEPLNKKLSGPESRNGYFCGRENALLLKGFEPRPVWPAASRYTEYAIRIHVKKVVYC